ncbi:methylglyoxal synthase [Maritalea porphyrae]|uniref:Methylglyoxal synthase n=1 Tax=Maritalea porphyrae TaxID=880732 RepID=A0ABQ5URQ7_9HYPH|nr:methylglyoxal synthase [Maritalea porphyrae]GLQ16627.1 methylglyoxal synthase [Maritalea porphyrae]
MKKSLGLVAHDEKKQLLADWCLAHKDKLSSLDLYSTGTTGKKIIDHTGLELTRLESGPLGGDAQLGAMIAEKRLDGLIFFIDGLAAMPHDVDVKALIRLATIYDVPFACNRSTANAVLELF